MCGVLHVCVCTCPWSYQPAVQKASSQRVVEDHGPLTVDRLQYALYSNWDVTVSARCLLIPSLAFN